MSIKNNTISYSQELDALLSAYRLLETMEGMAKYLQQGPPSAWPDLQTMQVKGSFEIQVDRLKGLLQEEAELASLPGFAHLKGLVRKVDQEWWNTDFESEMRITGRLAHDAAVMLFQTRGKGLHSSSDWSDEELGLSSEFLGKVARWLSDSTQLKEGVIRLGTSLERLAADTHHEGSNRSAAWDFFQDAVLAFELLDAFAEFHIPTAREAGLKLIESIEFHPEIWGDLGPDLIAQYLRGKAEVPVQDSLVSRLFGSCRR